MMNLKIVLFENLNENSCDAIYLNFCLTKREEELIGENEKDSSSDNNL